MYGNWQKQLCVKNLYWVMSQTRNLRPLVFASRHLNCESFAKNHQCSKKLQHKVVFVNFHTFCLKYVQNQKCCVPFYCIDGFLGNFHSLEISMQVLNRWSFAFISLLSKKLLPMYGNWQKQLCVITLYWVITQTRNFRPLVFASRYPNCESFPKNHQGLRFRWKY